MTRVLLRLARAARRFKRRDEGNATIEFVMAVPVLMVLFLMSYEAGMLSTRHVMLERGLDQTVRLVRIGAIPSPTHELLAQQVCQYARIIPECSRNLRLEMVKRDPFAWDDISTKTACVDRREDDAKPVLGENTAGGNDLLILRACALFDPMLPGSAIGKRLPQLAGGGYALVASSSFVVEPN